MEENYLTGPAVSFLELCEILDGALTTFNRASAKQHSRFSIELEEVPGEAYLITTLRSMMEKHIYRDDMKTRTGLTHLTMKTSGKDGRRSLPAYLKNFLGITKKDWKFEVKWIVCYLYDIRPDPTKFPPSSNVECSHLCIDQCPEGMMKDLYGLECIDPGCLVWETKSLNQSRGNIYCTNLCRHFECRQHVCLCQGFHDTMQIKN
jgi:hypothetical protein